jgi:hypothetical protein
MADPTQPGAIYSTWMTEFDWTVRSNLYVLGTVYGTATNSTLFAGRASTSFATNIHEDRCSFNGIVTNVWQWMALTDGTNSYDATLTRINGWNTSSTSTWYVCEATNGATLDGSYYGTTNATFVCQTTNGVTTTFGDSTWNAGNTLVVWCDATKSEYNGGTNYTRATLYYTCNAAN